MARETTLAGAWLAMADKLGGVIKLAAACGVSRSTVLRWANGDFKPVAAVQAAVDALAAQHGVTGPFGTAPPVATGRRKRAVPS